MTTTSFDAKHNRPKTSRTSKSDMHRSMGGAKRRDELAQMAFEEGIKEGKRAARPKPAARKGASTARKVAQGAGRPVRAGVRQGIRELQSPVQQQIASGVKMLGFTIGLTFLYLILTTEDPRAPGYKPQFAGKITDPKTGLVSLPARALGWLTAHDKSIPYGGKS